MAEQAAASRAALYLSMNVVVLAVTLKMVELGTLQHSEAKAALWAAFFVSCPLLAKWRVTIVPAACSR
jgi:hypothetical protein